MKIQFVKNESSSIVGFTCIIYSANHIPDTINQIHDNQAELILATDIIDCFSIENVQPLISTIASKLRKNGKAVIGGTEIYLFCKNVVNSLISEPQASRIIQESSSMLSVSTVESLLIKSGLKIESCTLNGVHYEFTVSR